MKLSDISAKGSAFLDLSEADSELAKKVFAQGRAFFEDRAAILAKMPWLYTGVYNGIQRTHSGFNFIGEEFADDHRYPDIMESFNLMPSENTEAQLSEMMSVEFIRILFEFRASIVEAARGIFGRDYGFEKFSLLRVCYNRVSLYEPQEGDAPLAGREFLLDPHEDGHFLTFLTADKEGFVGRVGKSGPWELLTPGTDRLLVFPSLPYCLWQGEGQPYYHGVKRLVDGKEVDDRMSLAVFVNPDVEMEILNKDGISIGQLINASQERFGLPIYSKIPFVNEKTVEVARRIYGV